MSTSTSTTAKTAANAPKGKKPLGSEKTAGATKKQEMHFVFDRQNYTLMVAGLVIIVLGFALMYGKEDIFSFTKITLAPIVVMAGFTLEIYAIMKKPRD